MVERLTTISGSMFCGKTEELNRRMRRAEIAGYNVQVFKPIIDNRYDASDKTKSHSGSEFPATPVKSAIEILDKILPETNVVAVDEAQFLDEEIVNVVQELLSRDIKVVVAGLPLDFRGEPFGKMPEMIARSDEPIHLVAICDHEDNDGKKCGAEATRTQRFVDGKPANYNAPVILVGGKNEGYAARCIKHHIVPDKPVKDFSKRINNLENTNDIND